PAGTDPWRQLFDLEGPVPHAEGCGDRGAPSGDSPARDHERRRAVLPEVERAGGRSGAGECRHREAGGARSYPWRYAGRGGGSERADSAAEDVDRVGTEVVGGNNGRARERALRQTENLSKSAEILD